MARMGQIRVSCAAAALACSWPVPAVSTSSAPTSARRNTSNATKSTSACHGKPDVTFTTFDGSIEIRPWDKPEVQVVVEKRGRDKEAADTIESNRDQNGNRIVIDVKVPNDAAASGFQLHHHRSAKLIVSVPADIRRQRAERRRLDRHRGHHRPGRSCARATAAFAAGGSRATSTCNTGDGSIRLDGIKGALSRHHGRRQHRRGRPVHRRPRADPVTAASSSQRSRGVRRRRTGTSPPATAL